MTTVLTPMQSLDELLSWFDITLNQLRGHNSISAEDCISGINLLPLLQFKFLHLLGPDLRLSLQQEATTSTYFRGELLFDENILEMFLCSGDCGVSVNDNVQPLSVRWFEAFKLLHKIKNIDETVEVAGSFEQRLAVAVSLTFYCPLYTHANYFSSTSTIDPLRRYLQFKIWKNDRRLLPSFSHLSAWNMRYVVGSFAMDEELAWARRNINPAFRSNIEIGEAVLGMVTYTDSRSASSGEVVSIQDSRQFYDNLPRTLDMLLRYGAVCGGISAFGVSMAQAHGIPAMCIAQPGHCAFIYQQDEDTWKMSNGCGGWDASWRHDFLQITWGEKGWLIQLMHTSQKDFASFSRAERLRLLASFEPDPTTKYRILHQATTLSPCHFQCWRERIMAFLNIVPHLDQSALMSPWRFIPHDYLPSINSILAGCRISVPRFCSKYIFNHVVLFIA